MTFRQLAMAAFIGFAVPTMASAATPEEMGLETARKEEQAFNGYGSETAEYEMILRDAKGSEISRKMTYAAKEIEDDGDRSRVEFQWPADVKGTRLLTWTHKTKSDDQWLYLPALETVKRIAGGNKSSAFMGSEFAYEDLASIELEKYTYKFEEETTLDGRDIWRYERVPTDPKSGYSRHMVYTDKEYLQPLKVEYYDRKGDLLKTMTFKGYQKHGDYWRWSEIHVVNAQTQKESVLKATDRKLGVSLDDAFFESSALED